MEHPLISVMMPSYNHANYIEEAIKSVLNQTYTNFELLIADDGSTDHSGEVIRSFQDERIHFQEFKNNTCFKTWDFLRDHVKGKYVAYIGSDDIWEYDKLEKQVHFLETNNEYKACFTWATGIGPDSEILTDGSMEACFSVENRTREQWIWQLTKQNNCLVAPSFMMDRNTFLSLNGFRMTYRQIPDWDLWLRFLQNNQLYIIPEKLVRYRVHPNGENANVSSVSDNNTIRLNNEHAHMISSIIIGMSDDLFFSTFKDELQVVNEFTPEKILCEKFMWLIRHFNAQVQTQGIFFYYDHIMDSKFEKCLEEKYGFGREDFFKLELECGCAKAIFDAEQEAKESSEMVEKAISYLEKMTEH